jgi:hypothetical protein
MMCAINVKRDAKTFKVTGPTLGPSQRIVGSSCYINICIFIFLPGIVHFISVVAHYGNQCFALLMLKLMFTNGKIHNFLLFCDSPCEALSLVTITY